MSSEEVATPSRSGGASDLIATLLHRSPRLAMGLAASQLVWPAAKNMHRKFREHSTYTVKIPATDEIYDELHEWVLSLLPEDKQRALVAWTARRSDHHMIAMDSSDSSTSKPPRLRLRYDGSREQTVAIAGHRIKIQVSDGDYNLKNENGYSKPAEIVFTATSLEAQQALLGEINEVAGRSHHAGRRPVFRMLNKWGDWQRLDDLPDRTLDSVILADGQLERIVADVDAFLAGEAEYLRRCIPWHRGHLYEGPPGTGKTSVARAVASHFNMDIWYLPLADVNKDCDLLGVINRISPRSMLLLEDADVFHAATQRDDVGGRVTLSGLLNALDGIATPHGLFTVLTTNTPDILDAAVIRPGRVDLNEHFAHADDDQVGQLLTRWYASVSAVNLRDVSGLPPAEIVEVCKRHPDDPLAAIRDIKSRRTEALR